MLGGILNPTDRTQIQYWIVHEVKKIGSREAKIEVYIKKL